MEATRTLLVNFLEETQQSLPKHPQTSTSIMYDPLFQGFDFKIGMPIFFTPDDDECTLGRILELPIGPDLRLKYWTVYTKERSMIDCTLLFNHGQTHIQERWITQSYSFKDLKSAVRFAVRFAKEAASCKAKPSHKLDRTCTIMRVTNEDCPATRHVTRF